MSSNLAKSSLDLQQQELQWRGFLLRKKNVRISRCFTNSMVHFLRQFNNIKNIRPKDGHTFSDESWN